jgi:hypothetical protein
MKPAIALLLTLGLTLFLLAGCELGLLAEIAAQLRDPRRSLELVREDEDFTVRFRQPIIPRSSLPALGFGAAIPPGASVRAVYGLEVNGSARREVSITLRFTGDYLQSISVPGLLFDLLGRPNIEAIFRTAGGADLLDWTGDPVAPATIEVVLAAQGITYDPRGDCVLVKLSPTAAAARCLVVKLQRHPPDEDFKDITVSFRK